MVLRAATGKVVFREKLADVYPESTGKIRDDFQRRVALAAFHAANVGPMAAASSGELLLRPAAGLSEHSHTFPEPFEKGRHSESMRPQALNRQRL
jgi:hypothetical protein